MSALVILGSGLAGYMLAKEWRKLDSNSPLVIITSGDGSFYSKPLLSTAFTQKKNPQQLIIADNETMAAELNAKIYTYATVTAIDPINKTLTFNQQNIAFSRLILACGAQKIYPPLTGDAVAEIYSVNDLAEYQRFHHWLADKKRLAILGTGLVGCEFANDLTNAGYQVTMIAPENYPLATLLPSSVGSQLKSALAEKGITWQLGHLAVEINRTGAQYDLTLSNQQRINVDGIFSAIGLRPETSLAKQAGIIVNRGIVVNRWLQTNFPHIFALGDCAEVDGVVQMYVAPLLQCARALAKILNGGDEPVHYPSMPIVVKTPAFPLILSPPPMNIIGEWHLQGEGHDLIALFHDHCGQLRGFALAGNKIRDKMTLAKQLPLVFNE